ncbi:hypothetical protein M501DRAFT_931768 [Patellaria atrata CBS 101060]|uniref:SWR1-complex protein 3 domain-containing protein n=1 Tax=Patellaria atrata CBS 101060 TaxID=1346257 RepID=A0A9P4VSI3_9PEZI|nr:hypothetical protein M501DRAFT_931768 [Patellaria atrata CBS 101060]
MTGEKRRSSRSLRDRGEPPTKKRSTTPVKATLVKEKAKDLEPETPVPEPIVVKDVVPTLPTKVVEARPIPTVDEPQPVDLSPKDYQSFAQSRVLSSALERSRARWAVDGIFEKYVTKVPHRKKTFTPEQEEEWKTAKALEKELCGSMKKLGDCQLTIEPHVFSVTLYQKKPEDLKKSLSHHNARTTDGPVVQYSAPPYQSSYPYSQTPRSQQVPQQPPAGQPVSNGPTSIPASTPQHALAPAASTASANAPPAPDPVIHMLAQRATTDPELKYVMKIVAAGEATEKQLKYFQKHIEEFTAVLKSREAAASTAPPQVPPSPADTASPAPSARPVTYRPVQVPLPSPQPSLQTQPTPPPKPEPKPLFIEFVLNGDRFLFPRSSILEYLPDRTVLASFLVVLRGSKSASPHYDPETDYYQPVTVRFAAQDPGILGCLAQAVDPVEEVRRYMDGVMDGCRRAEYVCLAARLPLKGDGLEEEDAEAVGVKGKEKEKERTGTPVTGSNSATPIAGGTPVSVGQGEKREKRKYVRKTPLKVEQTV